MFGYVSFAQLSAAIRSQLYTIPADVDLIVGIPRSGMVPAYQIGLFLNRLVADIDTFVADGSISHGHTRKLGIQLSSLRQARHILLVDDSIATGGSMQKALARIQESGYTGRISTCAAIVAPSHKSSVNISFITMPQPRMFEWNAFHHACVENACFDMDGVLCVDPTAYDNDDGPRYEKFLANALPLFLWPAAPGRSAEQGRTHPPGRALLPQDSGVSRDRRLDVLREQPGPGAGDRDRLGQTGAVHRRHDHGHAGRFSHRGHGQERAMEAAVPVGPRQRLGATADSLLPTRQWLVSTPCAASLPHSFRRHTRM
jgi:hypoxanthine phosphoribosyltransferase